MVDPVVVCDARAPTYRLYLTQLLVLTTAQFKLEARTSLLVKNSDDSAKIDFKTKQDIFKKISNESRDLPGVFRLFSCHAKPGISLNQPLSSCYIVCTYDLYTGDAVREGSFTYQRFATLILCPAYVLYVTPFFVLSTPHVHSSVLTFVHKETKHQLGT